MTYFDVVLLGLALSMDAFAVSICQGLGLNKIKFRYMLKAGLFYGLFQGLMPLIGYFLGTSFYQYIASIDHFLSFGLLLLIGGNMLREEEYEQKDMKLKSMFLYAIATSIDALAVGVTFSFSKISIYISAVIIASITFVISGLGIKLGSIVGSKYNRVASKVGGVVLILIGIKILIEHLL